MKKIKSIIKKNKYLLTAILFFIAVLCVWEIYVKVNKIQDYVFPALSDVLKSLIDLMKQRTFYKKIGFTCLRILKSMILSAVLGLVIGLIGGLNKFFRACLKPIIACLKSIPVMAITLVVLIIFGGEETPVVIGFIMAFPITYSQTVFGIENIDKEIIEITKTFKGSFIKKFARVYVPLSTPSFLQGLQVSGGLCIKAVISAEIISFTVNSIGMAMYVAKSNMFTDTPILFAYCFVALFLSLIFDGIIYLLKKALVRW